MISCMVAPVVKGVGEVVIRLHITKFGLHG